MVCDGKRKHAGNFIFKRTEVLNDNSDEQSVSSSNKSIPTQAKHIIAYNTSDNSVFKEYISISECVKDMTEITGEKCTAKQIYGRKIDEDKELCESKNVRLRNFKFKY